MLKYKGTYMENQEIIKLVLAGLITTVTCGGVYVFFIQKQITKVDQEIKRMLNAR